MKNEELLKKLLRSRSKKFTILCEIAKLDPKNDFKYADLQESDFSNQDLQEFDFSGSDLRGSNFRNSIFNERSLANARFFDIDMEALDKNRRILANLSLLAKSYYERIANSAALSISLPELSIIPILNAIVTHDTSQYARSFADFTISVIQDPNETRNRKRMIIANIARKQSYPLDRQKYKAAIREAAEYAPSIRSFIDLQ